MKKVNLIELYSSSNGEMSRISVPFSTLSVEDSTAVLKLSNAEHWPILNAMLSFNAKQHPFDLEETLVI